jgi:serine/threonine protein kinase
MFEAGDRVGHYELIRFLGNGAFGEVWLAERRGLATTQFALKLPLKNQVNIQSVKNEAQVWAQAKGHPNVLPIIEADVYNGQVAIVSEYAPGGSLADWMGKHNGRAPTVEAAVEIISSVLDGLQHLHTRADPIIHRDLKPANILLRGQVPCIADFGLAVAVEGESVYDLPSGSVSYMAPEALRGKISKRADLWSVGVIFYELLAGHKPFRRKTTVDLYEAINTSDPRPLPQYVPAPLGKFVLKSLNKRPEERYQSAAEMQTALREASSLASGTTADVLPLIMRSHSLFGYETEGGRGSVLWGRPEQFTHLLRTGGEAFQTRYSEWRRHKRKFAFEEVLEGTWIKIGDHGEPHRVRFLQDGSLTERNLFNFSETDFWGGVWRLIDGVLRMNIGKYELDVTASVDGLHSGIEDKYEPDGVERNAYFRVVHATEWRPTAGYSPALADTVTAVAEEQPTTKVISFSGNDWIVKAGDTPCGPGPNYYSDSQESVWADEEGRLHLKIRRDGQRWLCAEVICKEHLGYGRYVFYVKGRVDKLDKNVVVGLFTWDSLAPDRNYGEVDIEFSKWGGESPENAQYVVQPSSTPGNLERFNMKLNGSNSTHIFDWRAGEITFQSVHGHHASPPGDGMIIHSWVYKGVDVPVAGHESPRINLWLYRGRRPASGEDVEIVVERFEFYPA